MLRVQKRIPKLRQFHVRELQRDELVRLHEKRAKIPLVTRLRDSHHRIARLFASGLRPAEVAERSGYSYNTICNYHGDPAFQELIAHYRKMVDEAYVVAQDAYHDLATRNMLAAERHISDHIAELDEKGELLPVRTALAISADKADRFGYGKKQTNLNVNVDFAKNLEGMLKRSGKALPAPTVSGRQTLDSSPVMAAVEARSNPLPAPTEPPSIRRRIA